MTGWGSGGPAEAGDGREDRDAAERRPLPLAPGPLAMGVAGRPLAVLDRTGIGDRMLRLGGDGWDGHTGPSGEAKYEEHRTRRSRSVVQWTPMTATTLEHPAVAELELTAVLHALSDPMRLQIARELATDDVERRCGSFDLPVTKSTCTHHFRVLREAGVIEQWADGTAKMTRLRRADLDARFPGLLDAILGA